MEKITYHKVGDYYIPNLTFENYNRYFKEIHSKNCKDNNRRHNNKNDNGRKNNDRKDNDRKENRDNCESSYKIGKYGRARLRFIKKYKLIYYTDLLLTGNLYWHLAEIDKTATERINTIIKQLAEAENIDENLKQTNQLEWIKSMNNIKNRAEEIVYNEIIYV